MKSRQSPISAAASRDELAGAVALFHSLSDPTRLAIARHLADGEARVIDLTRALELPQSTVSSHLACLRDCGLITGRPEGRQMFYALAAPELMDLFAAAETLLAATGNAGGAVPELRHRREGHRMSTPSTELTQEQTERLTRRGLRLAQFTVAYNVIEGVVAITAGILAGLVSVIGFGVDSAIESIAAVLVGLRLSARLRHGVADERKERLTLRLVAVSFFVLAAYVTIEGIRSLLSGEEPERSPVAIVLLALSLIVMPILAAAKKRVGVALQDNLILADAVETKICVLLSISTLAGVGVFQLTGAGWPDPVAGFVIAAFAIHEGREAWNGELVDDD